MGVGGRGAEGRCSESLSLVPFLYSAVAALDWKLPDNCDDAHQKKQAEQQLSDDDDVVVSDIEEDEDDGLV